LPAASTTRQKEGITMTKMGGRNYLLDIKPIIMFVLPMGLLDSTRLAADLPPHHSCAMALPFAAELNQLSVDGNPICERL
jgi:hypothetical protein